MYLVILFSKSNLKWQNSIEFIKNCFREIALRSLLKNKSWVNIFESSYIQESIHSVFLFVPLLNKSTVINPRPYLLDYPKVLCSIYWTRQQNMIAVTCSSDSFQVDAHKWLFC